MAGNGLRPALRFCTGGMGLLRGSVSARRLEARPCPAPTILAKRARSALGLALVAAGAITFGARGGELRAALRRRRRWRLSPRRQLRRRWLLERRTACPAATARAIPVAAIPGGGYPGGPRFPGGGRWRRHHASARRLSGPGPAPSSWSTTMTIRRRGAAKKKAAKQQQQQEAAKAATAANSRSAAASTRRRRASTASCRTRCCSIFRRRPPTPALDDIARRHRLTRLELRDFTLTARAASRGCASMTAARSRP